MHRRNVLKGTALGLAALASLPLTSLAKTSPVKPSKIAALEHQFGGTLGVAVYDMETGGRSGYRADDRFLMCSTFKPLAVAAVLRRVDEGKEALDRRVIYGRESLLAHAPVTSLHATGEGMTVAELCQAAITVSDNTAGNLLLTSLGGPSGLNAFLRDIGDIVTRLDRVEPVLNTVSPDGPLDTTSPNAMLHDVEKTLFGEVLTRQSRELLTDWLCNTTNGLSMIRAGLPKAWRGGDKPGRGGDGSTNDVAVVWPTGRRPLLIAAYYFNPAMEVNDRDQVLADVGRVIGRDFAA
ncbi:class A beta-lactamase [Dyella halodurans]|uniref:Beta-lactamase n=1 Tax=Dyella halodurans TaxID=1920171 RepID=A0ABV9C8C9_9GAMM|nr:class A beta-lactamase [Dyella halodurans]